MSTNPDHSIHPVTEIHLERVPWSTKSEETSVVTPGLTKREYFAAMALQGQLAGEDFMPENQRPVELQAALAVRHADALIAALNSEA